MNKLQLKILEIKRHDTYVRGLRTALHSCSIEEQCKILSNWLKESNKERNKLISEKIILEKEVYLK